MMQHPLELVPSTVRKPLFYFLFVFTLLIFGAFRQLDQPLRTSAAPSGIVSFELAGTLDASQEMINSWDENARLFAAFGLGLDYLFMPVYALTLSLGLLLVGNEKVNWYQNLTKWMGWGMFIAALFDAVENYALWQSLTGNVNPMFPQIAALCAMIKFALLISGILVLLVGRFARK